MEDVQPSFRFRMRADSISERLILPATRDAWPHRCLRVCGKLLGLLPRTMAGLMTLGCIAAALPLLLALLLAGSQLDRLTGHSELLLRDGTSAIRLGEQLHRNLNDLERVVRQFGVLHDPSMEALIDDRIASVERTLQSLESARIPALADHVYSAQQALAQVAKIWANDQAQAGVEDDLAAHVHQMVEQADAIQRAGHDASDAQIEKLREASVAARRAMLICSFLLLPMAALLSYFFSAAVARSLGQLSRSITDLGNGRQHKPVVIRFPVEMQRLGIRLEWLDQRLRQLEAQKDSFLRHVSHELKTPLASLCEGAALLQEESLGTLGESQHEVAAIIAESADELGNLICNLLTYAEWRKQSERPEPGWFDVGSLVDGVLQRHHLWLTRRQIVAELRLDSCRLFGHRARLRTALENLLSNAIKHAPPCSAIEITVTRREGRCELSVRDHGRGVPESQKSIIFEPFVRGSETEEAAVRGTGVGLSIVQEAAHLHQGTVEVEDAEPGARFRLVWPHPPGEF